MILHNGWIPKAIGEEPGRLMLRGINAEGGNDDVCCTGIVIGCRVWGFGGGLGGKRYSFGKSGDRRGWKCRRVAWGDHLGSGLFLLVWSELVFYLVCVLLVQQGLATFIWLGPKG